MIRIRMLPVLLAVAATLAACAGGDAGTSGASGTGTPVAQATASAGQPSTSPAPASPAPGPYAGTGPGAVQGAAAAAKPLVYVPSQRADTVQVIDPATYTVIATHPVARSPEHVVPSHDLTTLWVNSDAGNALTAIDPVTGAVKGAVPVEDPYNLYFTPDGKHALVMASRLRRIDVRDATTMALQRSLPVACGGVNHADFSADLTTLLVSCEFSGELLVLDAAATGIRSRIDLNAIPTPGASSPAEARSMRGAGGGPVGLLHHGASSMPQDVRLAPDGATFLVADMLRNGVWIVNAATMTVDRFLPTGKGTHAIYPSRDTKSVYVSNRDEGTITVLDAASLQPTKQWALPGGGSPDMGGVTADGTQLWLSGRYDGKVYVIDTATGSLLHSIPVRPGPHGVLVWPQPGRYSLGHTGNMR